MRSYLQVPPDEDRLTACVVAAFNQPGRSRASMRKLLATFVPADPDHAWVWRAFESGAHVSARLLTGPSRPDMLLLIDRGQPWPEAAAVVEVKIAAEFNVPALRAAGKARWAELGLRPHLKLWTNPETGIPGVPQTDTYALFPFDTSGCLPDHTGPGGAVEVHDRTDTALRLLYPHSVPAAAATAPSVTGHLWQTTTFAAVAAALAPAGAPERDTTEMAWDRCLAVVLRTLAQGKGRVRAPRLNGITPREAAAARKAALAPSLPPTAGTRSRQRPAYDPHDPTLDPVYTLQVEWDHHKAAAIPTTVLRSPAYEAWSYTTCPTTIEWVNDEGKPERDDTTGRSFRLSYDELAHRFILRAGPHHLRRLEVHAGLGHAARFGWREGDELRRIWPTGFPTGAGHLVVSTRNAFAPMHASGPECGLVESLLGVLKPFGAVVHDVQSIDAHERICAWLTYPPFPLEPRRCSQHPSAAGCQHQTTEQLVGVTTAALPVIAQYVAHIELDPTPPYPIWQAHQD